MEERKRQQRREEFARLDAWLQRLQKEHPVLSWLLTAGIALVIFGLAMLVRWIVESGGTPFKNVEQIYISKAGGVLLEVYQEWRQFSPSSNRSARNGENGANPKGDTPERETMKTLHGQRNGGNGCLERGAR